jgi:hypothetical protein
MSSFCAKILSPKNLNPNCKHIKAVQKNFRTKKLLVKKLVKWTPGANVIKHFTAVIYHHSTVIPSFCVIKLYYLENNSGMAVNYHNILTLGKSGLELPQ